MGCALAIMLEKKREGGGEVVNVPATRLMDVAAGQEMNVRRLEADVPLNLPVQIHIECSSDVAGSVVERGNLDESRHGIHGIVARVPPKRTRASVNRNLWQGVHGQGRMHANNVLRPDQAGIVEVTGFEEERVEGPEVPIIWIVVTAGGAALESEPHIPRRVPSIAYIYRRAPREDRFVAKAAHLEHLLRFPIPMVAGCELARAQHVAVLVPASRGILSVFAMDPQIVQVETQRARRVEIVSSIDCPKCGRMIFRINMPRILNRLCQKGADIPTWPRVKRLESVESEWNVWGRASGHEPSCPKTHAEATNTQREAFVVLQPRNHINKRKLQVYGVVLNWRGWL